MPENVAAATLNDAFCEEIAVRSIIDVQSYRIAAHIASKFLRRSTSDLFYSLNVHNERRAPLLRASHSIELLARIRDFSHEIIELLLCTVRRFQNIRRCNRRSQNRIRFPLIGFFLDHDCLGNGTA